MPKRSTADAASGGAEATRQTADRPLSLAAIAAAGAVDATALTFDLTALVRLPSVTGAEGAIAANLADRLEALGLEVEIFHPDPADIRADPDWPGEEVSRTTLPVVLGRVGKPSGRHLVLTGHTDVVPAGDPDTWTLDPFSGQVIGGELYGRGACDMKGGVAAILAAIRALRDTGALSRLRGELVVALVPSEEDGGQGTLAAIRAGASGDMAVIAEPTGLDLVVAHAGAITFRLTVPGRAAHASRRTEGVSALANLQTLITALEADEARRCQAERDPLMAALGMPYPTMIGKVSGGEWASTVMDRVEAEGRYGVRLGQSPEDAAAELRACVAEACAADPFLREHPAAVDIVGARFASSSVPAEHPLPAGLASVAEAVTGREPPRTGVPYGCDMRLFINVGKTPCVVFGPGDVRLAHGADERVPLSEVVACARVLAAWVANEIGPPGAP